MKTFKSFVELKKANEDFEAARQRAYVQDEMSSAWRWLERNIDFKSDAALPLRRVNSHGCKGVFKTLAPIRCHMTSIAKGAE